jgi:hypothetical protein
MTNTPGPWEVSPPSGNPDFEKKDGDDKVSRPTCSLKDLDRTTDRGVELAIRIDARSAKR